MAAKLTADYFARRLKEVMGEQGLSQSDLARRIWGVKNDHRGSKVAANRGRISMYLKGNSLPDPDTVELIAGALNMTTAELCDPVKIASASPQQIQMTVLPGGRAHLLIDCIVDLETATHIVVKLSPVNDPNGETGS